MILYAAIAAVSVLLAAKIGQLGRVQGQAGVLTRGRQAQRILYVLLFLVLFVPSALRQATGNDYMRYVEFFHLASVDAYVPTEEGFNLFVKLIYGLCGYENYLLVFALFAFFTILLFLLAIRDEGGEDFGLCFFLFMMSGCYFQTYNTVRYYFALSVALFSLRFFFRREYLWFVLSILFAATFHKSVFVVLVLYPMAAYAWKRWQLVLLAVLGAGFYATRSRWMEVIIKLYPSYEDTEILAAGGSISWPNIGRCAFAASFLVRLSPSRGEPPGADREDAVLLSGKPAGPRDLRLWLVHPGTLQDLLLPCDDPDLPHPLPPSENSGKAGKDRTEPPFGRHSGSHRPVRLVSAAGIGEHDSDPALPELSLFRPARDAVPEH